MKTNATRGLFIARHLFAEAKTIQICKQSRIRCVFWHFFCVKINGFANKSEFVVQPYSVKRSRGACHGALTSNRVRRLGGLYWRLIMYGGLEGKGKWEVVSVVASARRSSSCAKFLRPSPRRKAIFSTASQSNLLHNVLDAILRGRPLCGGQ